MTDRPDHPGPPAASIRAATRALLRPGVRDGRAHAPGPARKSGEPYITHPSPSRTSWPTSAWTPPRGRRDAATTPWRTPTTRCPALTSDSRNEVALLVDGVTKLDKAFFGGDAEVETIRKMLVRAAQDVRG